MRLLSAAADALGRPLSEEQLGQFRRFGELLLEWNRRMNLTAIRDPADVETLHFVDSIAGLLVLPPEEGITVVDVGTGGGLPGLALKIARPDLRMTLLDATRKKADYLEEVVRELRLEYVEVLTARAEEVGQDPERRELYDVALARALAPLPVLVELCLPLVRVGGRVVAYKKADQNDELLVAGRALSILGGRRLSPQPVDLPGLPDDRRLVVLVKEKSTPKQYPRLPGVPKQRPLV